MSLRTLIFANNLQSFPQNTQLAASFIELIPALLSSLKNFYHKATAKIYEQWLAITDKIPFENWRTISLHSLPFWAGSIIAALVAVFYSKIFSRCEALTHSIIQINPLWFLIISPLLMLAAWWLVYMFAPAASGSGIPQLMAALNANNISQNKKLDFLLGVKVFAVKIVSSLTAALGGAVIGREGPTIQLSASVFYLIHKFLPAKWPRISRERMLIAGGAAGLAAAFNTPLGGVVFVIEELSNTHIKYFRSSLLFAVVFAGMTAQMVLGPYLYMGYPNVGKFDFQLIPYVIVFSIVTALAGAFTAEIILKVITLKARLVTPWQQAGFVLFCGLLLGVFIYAGGTHATGSGKDVINEILFYKNSHIPWYLFPLRVAGMVVSYATGVAGGVFATSLSAGAALGNLLQQAIASDVPSKILILVSMIGFLTGVTRSPFTSSVLVLEMTDRHSAIFYLMLSGIVSLIAARAVSHRSFYHHLQKRYL